MTSKIVERDVAVVSVAPSAVDVYGGEEVNVNVVVKNEGNVVQTFNVIAYYNESVIETRIAAGLTPDTSTTLTFTWNTLGISPDNYTISAMAEPVSGETDFADNLFTDGTVEVNIPNVNFDPNRLDLQQPKPELINATLWLVEGYKASQVDHYTILMEYLLPAIEIKMEKNRLVAVFDGQRVVELIEQKIKQMEIVKPNPNKPYNIPLTIAGKLRDGTRFKGTEYIKVLIPSPNSG